MADRCSSVDGDHPGVRGTPGHFCVLVDRRSFLLQSMRKLERPEVAIRGRTVHVQYQHTYSINNIIQHVFPAAHHANGTCASGDSPSTRLRSLCKACYVVCGLTLYGNGGDANCHRVTGSAFVSKCSSVISPITQEDNVREGSLTQSVYASCGPTASRSWRDRLRI